MRVAVDELAQQGPGRGCAPSAVETTSVIPVVVRECKVCGSVGWSAETGPWGLVIGHGTQPVADGAVDWGVW